MVQPEPTGLDEIETTVFDTLKVPAKYRKAIAGAVTAGVASAVFALSDGHIDGGEIWLIVSAVLAPFGIVFGVKNKPSK